MADLDHSFRSLSPQEKLEVRIAKGVEVIRDGEAKSGHKSWVRNVEVRKRALAAISAPTEISLSAFAKVIRVTEGSLTPQLEAWTGKKFKEGGREIIKGILERIEQLEAEKKSS